MKQIIIRTMNDDGEKEKALTTMNNDDQAEVVVLLFNFFFENAFIQTGKGREVRLSRFFKAYLADEE